MSNAKEFTIRFPSAENAEFIPDQRDDSPLKPDEVSGHTLYTLVSPGTELNVYRGEYVKQNLAWGRFPFIPGYAAAVEIEAVGSDVTDCKPGDRAFCMGFHRTWQRFAREQIILAPKGCSSKHIPFARLMNITMTTLTTTEARPGAIILVTGLGPVGLLGALMFQRCGYRVIGCDPLESRQKAAVEAGLKDVRAAVPVDDPNLAGAVAMHLECSGHEQAVLDGCSMVRKRGEIVLVGVPMVRKTELYAQEVLNKVFRNWLVLRSGTEWWTPKFATNKGEPSLYGNMATAMDWMADGSVKVDSLCEEMTPENPQEIYQNLLNRSYEKPTVLLDWTNIGK
jgi:threonine dehydrogenase-like Zn-dependent dehydrogenase